MTNAASDSDSACAATPAPPPADVGDTPPPAPLDSVDRDGIRSEVERQFQLVPAIGTRWRWYDIPYRFLHWLLQGRPRRFIPWRLRLRLNNRLNFFNVFDHYERLKIEQRTDSLYSLVVPTDEAVEQGGIWVVEFFPPSYYADLVAALKKNGWDRSKFFGSIDGSNADEVKRARRGRGFAWKRFGMVANPDSPYLVMDAKREVLPKEFDLIELTGYQLGTSLTAVVAFVRLSEHGRTRLNEVWKAEHEPLFEWRGLQRPNVQGRHFSAIRATQRERQRLHDVARDWLAERCGGFFAGCEGRHPVIDFNVFSSYDATAGLAPRHLDAPLRALGMEGSHLYNYVSPQLPGAVFVQGDTFPRPDQPLQNCWGVIGARGEVERLNDQPGYGDKPYSVNTLAAIADDVVRSFLIHVAVVHYARQLMESAALARDTARLKHRQFSPRQLDALKRDLLATSLDLPAVARDTASVWTPQWKRWEGIEVMGVAIPGITDPPKEFDLIEEFGKSREELFERLLADDATYRGVLATTSSLGASAASARLGRRALLVSFTSLLVSATTLITVNGDAVWRSLVEWLPVL